MCQGNLCLMLTFLIVCCLHVSDGCGRTPARTKPQETTANPIEGSTARRSGHTTRHPSGGRLKCTQEEVNEAACLNGGTCFALDLLDSRSAHCHCADIWRGTRCEEFDDSVFDKVLSADKVEKAGIAAGVVVLIIITTVIVVYLVVKKRKQRKERAEANGNANGHAGKALMGCDKGTFDSEEGEKCTDV